MNDRLLDPLGLLLAMSGRLPPVPLTQIDCDELTAYLLALAFSLDMPAEIVTVAADPTRPSQFTHIYLRFQHPQGSKIPFDLTAGPYPGHEPSQVYRRRVWTLGTPIELSDFPESDRAAAQAVAAVIATARAAASQPAFQFFLKHLARWLLEGLSSLILQEQERRRETSPEFRGSFGEGETHAPGFFRDRGGADLQALREWFARCMTELEADRVDVRRLLESGPALGTPESTAAQTVEGSRFMLEHLLARVASFGQGRS